MSLILTFETVLITKVPSQCSKGKHHCLIHHSDLNKEIFKTPFRKDYHTTVKAYFLKLHEPKTQALVISITHHFLWRKSWQSHLTCEEYVIFITGKMRLFKSNAMYSNLWVCVVWNFFVCWYKRTFNLLNVHIIIHLLILSPVITIIITCHHHHHHHHLSSPSSSSSPEPSGKNILSTRHRWWWGPGRLINRGVRTFLNRHYEEVRWLTIWMFIVIFSR